MPSTSRESGFTLVGLLIAVAVVNVALAVAVTSWVTLDQRAREAELIFRGQEIARAIGCYQQGNAGQQLLKLEQLVETSCLRRVYRDPMTRDGKWRILRQEDLANGTIAALMGLLPEDGTGATSGIRGTGQSGGLKLQFQLQIRGSDRPGSTSTGQGIVGVVSTSGREALREVQGRRKYGEWVFLSSS